MNNSRRTALVRVVAFVFSAVAFFGVGYEYANGGVHGLVERPWCLTPLAMLGLAVALWLLGRRGVRHQPQPS